MNKISYIIFIYLFSSTVKLFSDESLNNQDKILFFEERIRPVLAQKCFACHSEEADKNGKLKAGLYLDSAKGLINGGDSGSAIVPGDLNMSKIYEAILYKDEDMAMPPKGKLPNHQIKDFEKWILMGAPWPGSDLNELLASSTNEEPYDWDKFRKEHWAFRPISNAKIPTLDNNNNINNPIDNFINKKLYKNGLAPNDKASKNILLRRAYLTLIGIPPTPNELQNFLNDNSSNAFSEIIDKLLNSKHYGERWARHWLDVARYSDGHGGFGDNKALPNAWRYRDWVIKALNNDLPYDQFVTQQIAGDLIDDGKNPIATGFFVVGPTYTSDGGDPEAKAQALAETLSDRVDTFSRAFLGLTAACARCHDHKFDPITTQDYYAIAGIFKNSRNSDVQVGDQRIIDAHNSWKKAMDEINKSINAFLEEEAKKLKVNRKEVEKSLTLDAKNKISNLRNELETLKKSEPEKPGNAHALNDSGTADMNIALRGDLRKKGEIAPRKFIEIIGGKSRPKYSIGSGRLELAMSVVDKKNPLTSRVMVNRIWGWHFGNGLVRTPSNFGVIGEAPTHSELLDWLSYKFINEGWSLKSLHKQIMMSATWQQSSLFNQKKFDIDGDNKFLWRFQPKKLEVESWRDSLLSVTGELDLKFGGSPDGEIINSKRRTIYATISRTGDKFKSDNFLRLFDFPAAVSTSPKRANSTVPQQYLFMLNSDFMNQRAAALGKSLFESETKKSHTITKAYEKLYSRIPETREIQLAQEWLGTNPNINRWNQYAQVLLSAHEMIQLK